MLIGDFFVSLAYLGRDNISMKKNTNIKQLKVLSDITHALCDNDTIVRIETLFSKDIKTPGERLPYSKNHFGFHKISAYSINQMWAKSISLGNGILMRRIGNKFVFRSKSGDAVFSNLNNDSASLWLNAVSQADGNKDNSEAIKRLYSDIQNEDLRKIIVNSVPNQVEMITKKVCKEK